MNFATNLQHFRKLRADLTQEALAEQLNVSRQTISKWENGEALPEIDKAIRLCELFSCTLDNLFRDNVTQFDTAYSALRIETVPAFRYVCYTVISPEPESDAIGRMRALAKEYGQEKPRVIGWDFPFLSPEQVNVYRLHGYTAAWILPEGITPEGWTVQKNPSHRYAAIHIEAPFTSPFAVIPNAYRTLDTYMRMNGYAHTEKGCIPCFETDGKTMDVYIACE